MYLDGNTNALSLLGLEMLRLKFELKWVKNSN